MSAGTSESIIGPRPPQAQTRAQGWRKSPPTRRGKPSISTQPDNLPNIIPSSSDDEKTKTCLED
eukprot:236005-Rhodomonas_salina.1